MSSLASASIFPRKFLAYTPNESLVTSLYAVTSREIFHSSLPPFVLMDEEIFNDINVPSARDHSQLLSLISLSSTIQFATEIKIVNQTKLAVTNFVDAIISKPFVLRQLKKVCFERFDVKNMCRLLNFLKDSRTLTSLTFSTPGGAPLRCASEGDGFTEDGATTSLDDYACAFDSFRSSSSSSVKPTTATNNTTNHEQQQQSLPDFPFCSVETLSIRIHEDFLTVLRGKCTTDGIKEDVISRIANLKNIKSLTLNCSGLDDGRFFDIHNLFPNLPRLEEFHSESLPMLCGENFTKSGSAEGEESFTRIGSAEGEENCRRGFEAFDHPGLLKRMRVLELIETLEYGFKLTEEDAKIIGKMSNLEELSLIAVTPMPWSFMLEILKDTKHYLRTLDIQGSLVPRAHFPGDEDNNSTVSKNLLIYLPRSLVCLNLMECDVYDEDMEIIRDLCPDLTELVLTSTKVTDKIFEIFKKSETPSLVEELEISSGKFSNDGMGDVFEAFPNLRIFYLSGSYMQSFAYDDDDDSDDEEDDDDVSSECGDTGIELMCAGAVALMKKTGRETLKLEEIFLRNTKTGLRTLKAISKTFSGTLKNLEMSGGFETVTMNWVEPVAQLKKLESLWIFDAKIESEESVEEVIEAMTKQSTGEITIDYFAKTV